MQYYAHLQKVTPSFSHETIQIDKWNKVIKVTRLTEEEKAEFDVRQGEELKEEFRRMIGFSRIWEAIKEAQKPIIGHNCFMDMMFTFDHFERRNPRKYSNFKETVTRVFPKYVLVLPSFLKF